MIKKLILTVAIATTLAACSSNNTQHTTISVIPVPTKTIEGKGSLALSDTAGKVEYIIDTTIVNAEGYNLKITTDGIEIRAKQPIGFIYAQATINQLVAGDHLPCVEIEDAPRFAYRGLMLDVSRHFQDVEGVKHVLDLMARYKLNRFHWHLTDDQGWRIEIKKYPLLTEKGAYRKFNSQDRDCQQFEKEYDNPDFAIPTKYMKIEGADTLYGGYYTQDEIREVVRYAAERGIEVLPELDMPGHLMAAIIGYPQISCKGKPQWGETFSDPLCVGNDEALQMVKDIYTEVASLFPYEYMHLGADEVEKKNWEACPKCQARVKAENLKGVEELQAWFVHNMETHFNSLGKKLIGWDEIVDGGLSPTATIMWWRNWAPEAVPTATAAGNKAIISPCFSLYLDYWESEKTLRNTYEFNPIAENLTDEQAANILGVQGNLWCETIPTMRRIEHQYFLRILAVAEMGWSQPSQRVWDEFVPRMIHEVKWLDANGINYRIPNLTGFAETNVFTDTASIWVECILPDVEIRYTVDGSNPTVVSPRLDHPLVINETTSFIFRAFRPDGTAGEMHKATYRKETFSDAVEAPATKPGLSVTRYDYKGRTCAEIATKGKEVEKLVMDSLNFSLDNSKGWGNVGLIGSGFIEIPQDGIYEFILSSDDGSMLYVDGQELINFDGPRSATIKRAQRAMRKGLHPIEVQYFENNNGGTLLLQLNGETIKNFRHQ